ncbi:MAG TPA: sugar phosphate nucleotidyltransferase [Candidatus Deferrimicrobium sp.]|nr:sugar phosphate nucleotidyltransferase [Candidatus Deferrimicrobium sp.]
MKGVIMAGGFGTRLRPLTINVPKPMVPVAGVPMMEHVICLLARHGIADLTVLLYFQAEAIKNHFGDGSAYGVSIEYVRPEEDFGTAGAVRYAADVPGESVLVISGDLVTDFDLTAALHWHRQQTAEATILLTRVENPLAYGIVITDHDGRIVRFMEKPSWGEAFSDTINTGIYILEPAAIQVIPPKTNFDFSQNLFPLMLSRKMRLYGQIMEGYWKDVGNIDEYQRAHVDFYDGSLNLVLPGEKTDLAKGVLWKGANVRLAADIELTGKVALGNDVVLESGVRLHNCVVGHRTRLGSGCNLKNCVIWSDCTVGPETVARASIVCSRTQIGRNVALHDDVVVSDDCVIGDAATVKANCKIWPSKTVDAGAIVSSSIVWGEKWNRELFTNSKITGLALSELTPEMAVRIGAAFGAFLGQRSAVVTSRDASDGSRLLRRGLMSGLLAAGVNVSDLETLPVPVVRYALHKGSYAAGIYVRHSPADFRLVDMIFFDGSGLDMPTSKLKKVERLYFGEDFERASLDQIGHLDTPQRVLENYRLDFLSAIDVEMIRRAGFKVVIDHSNGSSSQIFPTLFTELGISAVELNATLNPRKFSVSPEESSQAIVQLSSIVTSLHADVGILLNTAAEKLTVVDEQGQPIDSQLLLLIVTQLYLRTHQVRKIAVPVAASMGVEAIAERYGVEVIRVANDHLAMMEIRRRGDVDFVGGTRGGFIFPGFQAGADAMLAAVKVMEMMARTKSRMAALRLQFEHLSRLTVSVPCPWAKKGTVMRRLITDSEHKRRQLIDGVRILENDGWVLVVPDRLSAAFHILAESTSPEHTANLIDRYRTLVEQSQSV